jgi:pimeloyl-ACP methyl ester carboxylesterase
MPDAVRHLALPGGATVSWREAGAVEGAPLVLLHGIGSSSATWSAQLRSWPEVGRVLAWDAPGYGASTLLAGRPAAGGYAARLAEWLDGLQVQRPVRLVASSWGALIAIAFAARHPDRTASLVLGGPSTGMTQLPADRREAAAAERLARVKRLGTIEAAQQDAARLVAPAAFEQALPVLMQGAAELTIDGFAQAVGMLAGADGVAAVAAVRQPVLVISGTLDAVAAPALHAERLVAAAARARLERLEGCGHLPHLEMPERYDRIVRGFWDDVAERSTTAPADD